MNEQNLYRYIPKIDKFMETPEIRRLREFYGYPLTFQAVRDAEEEIRESIRRRDSDKIPEPDITGMISELPSRVRELLKKEDRQHMQHVINATGVILHTNLGRAPLNREIAEKISGLMTGYTNLEMNLEDGGRGSRYDHFSRGLCRLTGAEAAIAVNNNAAAVLVMLSALTGGREAVVSRGELVEVGGKFRIPEVMEQSGTRLIEVGTTNRTYQEDYINAVTPETAAFLKVHTSNYRITGFTCEASVRELKEAGDRLGIPVLVDLGSGSLTDYAGENSVRKILSDGADLVCFSGDKLFGGPQAGIIVGKKELIDKISRHPLMRAVRIGKFTAAALDATVDIYLNEKEPMKKIPVLQMIQSPREELTARAKSLAESLSSLKKQDVFLEIAPTKATTGGGSIPLEEFPSAALSIHSGRVSSAALAEALRFSEIPVIARIENDSVLLDMCTVFPDEEPVLAQMIRQAFDRLLPDDSTIRKGGMQKCVK